MFAVHIHVTQYVLTYITLVVLSFWTSIAGVLTSLIPMAIWEKPTFPAGTLSIDLYLVPVSFENRYVFITKKSRAL